MIFDASIMIQHCILQNRKNVTCGIHSKSILSNTTYEPRVKNLYLCSQMNKDAVICS